MSKSDKHKIKPAYSRTRVKTEQPKERRTRAVQSERNASDINNIVARAKQTGQLPVLMNRKPVPQMPDVDSYQDALDKVVTAQQNFARLPSEIRAKFDNDPSKLLFAIQNSDKNPELKKSIQELGFVEKSSSSPAGS